MKQQQYSEQHQQDLIRPEYQYHNNAPTTHTNIMNRPHFQTTTSQSHHQLQQQNYHHQHQNSFLNGNLSDNYFDRTETSEYIELQESRRIIEVFSLFYSFYFSNRYYIIGLEVLKILIWI